MVGIENPMRVTIVSTQQNWHGGEMQAALLAEGLRDLGHECSVLARLEGEFATRMRARNFAVNTFVGSGRSLRGLLAVRRGLREQQPSIVHANDAHALTISGIAGLGIDVPLRVAARRVDFALRSTFRYRHFADGLICVSQAVVDVCKSAGLPPSTLYRVPDGVEPSFAESGDRGRGRHRLDMAESERLLLTVAKLTDHKGHAYLLKALPGILEKYPNVVLAFAGDGELRSDLENEARALGVESAVRFLGYRRDVPDLFAAADVVVQPSHMEGLCSSLIDAMLAAKPIVATQAGGIPDLLQVENGAAPVGWLVRPKSPESLQQAIEEALDDRELAGTRGNAARQRAMTNFTAEHMVRRTVESYRNIANAKFGDQAAERVPGLFESGVTSSSCSDSALRDVA